MTADFGTSRRALAAIGAVTMLWGATVRSQDSERLRTVLVDTTSVVVGAPGGMGFTLVPSISRPLPMRLLLVGPDGRDAVLWAGLTTDRPTWSGLVDGEVPRSGRYELLAEVGSGGELSRVRRPVLLAVEGRDTAARRPLPEADTVLVRDFQAEGRQRQRSVWLVAGGAGAAVLASSVVAQAIAGSPPESAVRYAVAVGYVGGIATAAWGAFRLVTASSRRLQTPVEVPIEANIRRNRAVSAAPRARLTLTFLD
ncbi:MAG: hypothetical protein ACK53A_14325 [Gemmatimonadota bacterium]|jgi:hypothetical protein